ncbi:hypothetical protein GNP95_11035 [Paenibacillus woosongensis]|uniref:Uncharacterized protein n=1 Tax=Paenibacillus woosongensis TaxID=307580 RepID=A0A7X2Z273_9BACL|nr:hypothetical protein [Paenibacillus woosongensis]
MDLQITGTVKYNGDWKKSGDEIRKVDDEVGKMLVAAEVAKEIEPLEEDDAGGDELKELRDRAKALGVSNAGRLGEAKLKEGISEKEAEQLAELRKRAAELGIKSVDEKDAETLAAEIAAAEQK